MTSAIVEEEPSTFTSFPPFRDSGLPELKVVVESGRLTKIRLIRGSEQRRVIFSLNFNQPAAFPTEFSTD